MSMTPCHKRGTPCPPNALYVIGVTLILIGFLFFVCYCTAVIPEYAYTQDFKKTRCTIENSFFDEDVCCQSTVKSLSKCDKNFEYPCLVVNVSYTVNGDTEYSILFDNYVSMAKASPIAKCSYFHCGALSYKTHKSDAKEFQKEYGKAGDKVECYYNNKKKSETAVSIGSESALVVLLVISLPIILLGAVIMVTTKILDFRFQKHMELLLDSEEEFGFEGEEEEAVKESSPPSGPISRNKVSHSDTAHTSSSSSPPSKTHLHPPSQQDPSLLTDLLNSARTDQRPLSNTSRTTQDTNISRGARSRPTTGAAVNVEIAEYDENDESPSFRERVPAVRFELPKENEKAGGGEKKSKKKVKSKS